MSIGVALCGSVAGAALAATGSDFAAAARPLWFVCVGLGVRDLRAGLRSHVAAGACGPRERLAPLIEGTAAQGGSADVR